MINRLDISYKRTRVGKEVRHVWVNSSDEGSEVRNEKSKVIIHVGWGIKTIVYNGM